MQRPTARRPAEPSNTRQLLEMSCDWHWTLDDHCRLVQLHGRHLDAGPHPMQAQLGKSPWEWPGARVDSGDFERLRGALSRHERFYEHECSLRDHQGHVGYFALSGEPVFDADGVFAGFDGTTRELTQRKRAEALIALEHAVTRSIADAATSRKILQSVMRVICESEQWETAGYFRAEDQEGTTRLIAGWSGPGMDQVATDYYKHTADKFIPPGGMLSQVIATAQPLWLEAMTESQTTWTQRVQRTGERATFFFPVLNESQVIGVFAFASREPRAPDEPLLMTMRVIGEQVGQFLKRKQAEQDLRESEARFRALTELSSDWYWEIDADFRFTRIEGNHVEGAETLPGESAIGKRRWETGLEIEHPGGWDVHRRQLEAQIAFRDVVMMRADGVGAPRYIGISGEPMRNQRGEFIGYRGVGRDISERKLAENRLQHLATHDNLTGLPNRLILQDRADRALLRAQCAGGAFAVMLVDLDRFKQINDTLGHAAGDDVLRIVAQRALHTVRASDTVVRMGGDEFAILLPDVAHAVQAMEVAQKILVAIAEEMVIAGTSLRVTLSVGVALYPEHGSDLSTLLRNADAAMYDAKGRGRHAASLYRAEMSSTAKEQFELQTALRQALGRDEFVVHYQPLIDARSGEVRGLEALLRWVHPQRGFVLPGDFIALAEETGLIVPIGTWVLDQACADLARLRARGRPDLRMSVNLSPRQFMADGLEENVVAALQASGLPGDALELEITESVLMVSLERTQLILGRLRAIGVRIAIDDFGTGYSSLSYLANFPVQTVKIDRSFVQQIDSGGGAALLAGAIVAMAHSLGMGVVAEGVETPAQCGHLVEVKCELLQGFLFSRPVRFEHLAAAMARAEAVPLQRSRACVEVWAA